jgi:hypothetical protein
MRVATFIISLALCLVSVPAAAEWTSVVKSIDGNELFFDPATLKKGARPRAWFMLNYAKPTELGVSSSVTLREADCSEDKTRPISWRFYVGPMGGGNLFFSDNAPGEWDYASPGSMTAELIKILCGRR